MNEPAVKPKPAKVEKFIINIGLGNDNEPLEVFVGGMDGGDVRIKRGKDVAVTREVMERLDNAIVGVQEVDSDDPTKSYTVDRKRFPYSIIGPA